ncbi:IS1182 family transposase, partial [Vagococcus allomyrinae]|uniref:IS1182 family transposase n=1 Tax=Vagococcus allomyrinae TaxID=2794353 RepID=UPI001FD781D4
MYKNYNMKQVVLSLDLENELEEHDIAFAINQLVESIPDIAFEPFHHQMGASSYHPRMMLKLILCGYTQSIFSGRKIESLSKDSIRARWLTQSHYPNFRTINRFRVNPIVQPLLEECFVQFRNQLVSQELIDTDAIFIDGTKLEANANKYTFVWKKSINNYEKSLTKKSKELYQKMVEDEIIPALKEEEDQLTEENFSTIVQSLEQKVDELTAQIEASETTEERKTIRSERKEPRKLLKQFNDFKARKENYRAHRKQLGERNSYSKTDSDATFMRMKDDHMRNGQLKPGYNLQIATNNQYVLAYDIFPNPTDFKTLLPFLSTIKENYFDLPQYIVADAGYGSEENYQAIMDDFERTPLITYTMYQKEQTKKFKQNPFHTQNWAYDELMDHYVCPNSREVRFRNYSTRTDKYGFKRQLKMYECEDCSNCPLRSHCTTVKSNRNRVIQKNGNWEYFKAHARELLVTKETGDIYRRRKIDVEPAFGNLKANLGFTRLSVRGKDKVKNELGFALMATNLRKMTVARQCFNKNKQRNKDTKISFLIFASLLSWLRLMGQP